MIEGQGPRSRQKEEMSTPIMGRKEWIEHLSTYLELVLLGLSSRRRVEQVNSENLDQSQSARLSPITCIVSNPRFHWRYPSTEISPASMSLSIQLFCLSQFRHLHPSCPNPLPYKTEGRLSLTILTDYLEKNCRRYLAR